MTLHEAIRQGQVKIAQGLESGQMRSDGKARPTAGRISDEKALLRTKEKSPQIRTLSKILAVASGFAILVLLLFVAWYVMQSISGTEPANPNPAAADGQQDLQTTLSEQPGSEQAMGSPGPTGRNETTAGQSAQPSAPEGSNVIVITQVPGSDRANKLKPVLEYFNTRGVPVETIQRSGYTLLVTRAGFDYDPKRRQGSEGYRLLQQIRQLGLAYPEQSGDTNFGPRPFQDAYALKK